MAVLISADEFRERFDVSEDIENKRITPHIGAASRRLRKWVGGEIYDRALSPADNDDTDADLVADLKNAEAHLTMHFAIVGFNSPLSSKGILAVARTSEGREMRQYLPPEDTAQVAVQFLELAREIAGPYIAADSGIGFEIVETDINSDLPWLT